MMSGRSGQKAYSYLKKMGVNVILNCLIESYDGKIAKLSNGETLATQTLIWAAGVKGNLIGGFPEASTEKGKLRVNTIGQVLEDKENRNAYEDIFAIGDIAFMKTDEYPKGHPGLAQAAIQQGKLVGENFNRLKKSKPLKEFHYKNKGVLATIGRNKAIAELPRNIKVYGITGWFVWMSVHLLFLIGFRRKAVVLSNWIWNYFTFDRGVRIILRPKRCQ